MAIYARGSTIASACARALSVGKTSFDKGAGYTRLRRAFRQTVDDRTVGVLSGDPGVGKTSAIRNLIAELPRSRADRGTTRRAQRGAVHYPSGAPATPTWNDSRSRATLAS